ncbi:MAG: hypothetical protein IH937_02015, partial [Acidobacteria bacterium]|nr:hypothetical protein [Acidobacteriota bacterium]
MNIAPEWASLTPKLGTSTLIERRGLLWVELLAGLHTSGKNDLYRPGGEFTRPGTIIQSFPESINDPRSSTQPIETQQNLDEEIGLVTVNSLIDLRVLENFPGYRIVEEGQSLFIQNNDPFQKEQVLLYTQPEEETRWLLIPIESSQKSMSREVLTQRTITALSGISSSYTIKQQGYHTIESFIGVVAIDALLTESDKKYLADQGIQVVED